MEKSLQILEQKINENRQLRAAIQNVPMNRRKSVYKKMYENMILQEARKIKQAISFKPSQLK